MLFPLSFYCTHLRFLCETFRIYLIFQTHSNFWSLLLKLSDPPQHLKIPHKPHVFTLHKYSYSCMIYKCFMQRSVVMKKQKARAPPHLMVRTVDLRLCVALCCQTATLASFACWLMEHHRTQTNLVLEHSLVILT